MITLIIAGILLVLGLLAISKYNALIHLKNLVHEAWSGIDVQLKRRYDLISNLVATVQGYSQHEKQVFENVTKLRNIAINAKTVEDKSRAEGDLTQGLKTLFAVSENYPELKANQNFLELQKELSNIENQLQLSRRYYNGVVREYNTKIQVFPGNMIASIFKFEKEPYFELDAKEERENPKVQF